MICCWVFIQGDGMVKRNFVRGTHTNNVIFACSHVQNSTKIIIFLKILKIELSYHYAKMKNHGI